MAGSMTHPVIVVKVYHDPGTSRIMEKKSEDVSGWHRSSIRKGVLDDTWLESSVFRNWKSGCIGRVVIQQDESEIAGSRTLISPWYVYLETQEDLVSYLLTFDEKPPYEEVDAAAFYAPYVPLTMASVGSTNTSAGMPTVRIVTRYDHPGSDDA